MRAIIVAAVVFILAGCVSQAPIWTRPDVRAQAADFCAGHGGLDKIQPRSDARSGDSGGSYWVRCTDASMHLVSIGPVKGS